MSGVKTNTYPLRLTPMLATKARQRSGPPPSVPYAEQLALNEIVTRRHAELAPVLDSDPTLLIEENGTAVLVTRADHRDVPFLLHARPGDMEFGVVEEPAFPILSVVSTLATSGGPRFAGITVDVSNPEILSRLKLMISQPTVDLVVLDPAGRFAAAHRFELPLWARAQAHRALSQAWRHLESIPPERRSFEAARAGFQDYCNRYLTA